MSKMQQCTKQTAFSGQKNIGRIRVGTNCNFGNTVKPV